MEIRKILQTISTIPLLRKRYTVNPNLQADKDDFVNKYEATNDHLAINTVEELNTLVGEINNTTSDIDDSVTLINEALPKLDGIDEKVTLAQEAAQTATTKAEQATTSATNASNSKELAKKYANNPEDIAVEDNNFSALHWSKKAEKIVQDIDPSNALLKHNNLSDLTNIYTARDNLGLGTVATKDITTSSTDQTDKVLKVRDFGIGVPINLYNTFETRDLNDIVIPAIYYIPLDAYAVEYTNLPPMGVMSSGSLQVFKTVGIGSSEGVVQIYIRYNSADVYIRSMYYNNWKPWQQLAHSGNLKTINAHPLIAEGGGNITIDKAAVFLGNVDNTSDLEKPISTATQEALDTKIGKEDYATATAGGIIKARRNGSVLYVRIDGADA